MKKTPFLQFESYRRGLAASTLCNLVSQAVGFVTLLLFASYFGTQSGTDVYLYVTSTLLLVAGLITSLDASVVIPEFMRLMVQEGRQRATSFANGCLLLYVTLALIVAVATLSIPETLLLFLSRFNADTLQAFRHLILLTAPIVLGEVVTVFLADILVSQKYFTMPMLSTLLNRIIQVTSLYVFHDRFGIASMAIGALVAYGVQIMGLVYIIWKRLNWCMVMDGSVVRTEVWRNAGVSVVGNMLASLAQFVPTYLLSGFGVGVVSAANYALRIVNIPHNFLSVQVSSVVAVKLNQFFAQGKLDELDVTFRRSAGGLILMMTPLAVFLSVEANHIIQLLFERGSFDSTDTAKAATFLRWLALTIPFLAINTIVARTFMAAQKILQAFWFQLGQSLVLILAVYTGIHISGIMGYLAATLAFQLWNIVVLIPLMRQQFPAIRYQRTLGYFAIISVLCILPVLVLSVADGMTTRWSPLASVTTSIAVFLAFFMFIGIRFNLNDDLTGILNRIFPNHRPKVDRHV